MFEWLKTYWCYSGREVAYFTHPECLLHDPGEHHPDTPQRLIVLRNYLQDCGILDHVCYVDDVPPATSSQLLRVHTQAYLDYLQRLCQTRGRVVLDQDTSVSGLSFEAARYASGAVIQAVDWVCSNKVSRAFCAVRPPGHHASQSQASGFCLINHLSVGVAHALAVHDVRRVAIVDFDLHHGDGTDAVWHEHPQVTLFSLFEQGLFASDRVSDVKVPNRHPLALSPCVPRADWREAVMRTWLPALHACSPEIIFISAGFDGHQDEDMGSLGFSCEDYAWMTQHIVRVAQSCAQGRVVSVLEGGYIPEVLAPAVAAHLRVML